MVTPSSNILDIIYRGVKEPSKIHLPGLLKNAVDFTKRCPAIVAGTTATIGMMSFGHWYGMPGYGTELSFDNYQTVLGALAAEYDTVHHGIAGVTIRTVLREFGSRLRITSNKATYGVIAATALIWEGFEQLVADDYFFDAPNVVQADGVVDVIAVGTGAFASDVVHSAKKKPDNDSTFSDEFSLSPGK